MTRNAYRLAGVIAGAVLAVHTLSPLAAAAPAPGSDPIAPALVTLDAFQNSCTAQRQEDATAGEALANGQAPDDNIEAQSNQSWRSAFTNVTRGGPVQPRYCWFSQQFPDDPSPGPR